MAYSYKFKDNTVNIYSDIYKYVATIPKKDCRWGVNNHSGYFTKFVWKIRCNKYTIYANKIQVTTENKIKIDSIEKVKCPENMTIFDKVQVRLFIT